MAHLGEDFSGELVILPPLGPTEKADLADFLLNGVGPTASSPFATTAKGIGWDHDFAFFASDYKNLEAAAAWLTDHVIPKFVLPLRHMTGKLIVAGEGSIFVMDNTVKVVKNDPESEAPHGVKLDGTPKSKPGPKPKSLKEVLAEKKMAEEVALSKEMVSEVVVEELKQKIQELEAKLAAAKKPKKSKVPAGKRWVRLTIPKEIDKDKFIEGVKLTIMGIEGEPEVFE